MAVGDVAELFIQLSALMLPALWSGPSVLMIKFSLEQKDVGDAAIQLHWLIE